MNGLTPEGHSVMLECVRLYGVINALEAYMELEHATRYGELPDDARFLKVAVVDDGGIEFEFRSPDELRVQ